MSKQYKIKYFCKNCQEAGECTLGFGTLIKEATCPNCGCETLTVQFPPKIEHETQKKLLKLIEGGAINDLTLREIGQLVAVIDKPQIIKHHLDQLIKKRAIERTGLRKYTLTTQ